MELTPKRGEQSDIGPGFVAIFYGIEINVVAAACREHIVGHKHKKTPHYIDNIAPPLSVWDYDENNMPVKCKSNAKKSHILTKPDNLITILQNFVDTTEEVIAEAEQGPTLDFAQNIGRLTLRREHGQEAERLVEQIQQKLDEHLNPTEEELSGPEEMSHEDFHLGIARLLAQDPEEEGNGLQ